MPSSEIPRRKTAMQRVHSGATPRTADRNLAHLHAVRTHEIGIVLELLPSKGRVLEIGAGTGWQSRALADRGYDVSAIDLVSSSYRGNRAWPVMDYDGMTIPFEDRTFDAVFSSNTLEHIPLVHEFKKEIHRVLKPNGIALHVLPSSSWWLWTSIAHLLKCWTPPVRHGQHARSSLTEVYYFSRRW